MNGFTGRTLKWICAVAFVLGFGFLLMPNTSQAAEAKVSVPWENGKLVEGQIGKVVIKETTTLYKIDKAGTVKADRKVKKGTQYRVYSFKTIDGTTYYGVGSGFYVKKSNEVSYTTPSKDKLRQINNLSYIRPNLITLAKQGVLKGQPFKLNTVHYEAVEKYYNKKPDKVTQYYRQYHEFQYYKGKGAPVHFMKWINPKKAKFTVADVRRELGKPTTDFTNRTKNPVLMYELEEYLLVVEFTGYKQSSEVVKVELGRNGTDIYYKDPIK